MLLRWRFQELSRLAQLGQHMLDRLSSPVLVIDSMARILFSNAAGQRWLSVKHHPYSIQSTLQQASPWPQLLHLATQICGAHPVPVGTLTISVKDGPPTYLIGLPLREDHPVAQGWSRSIGIVVVYDQSLQPTPWPQLLRQLFGLTPAECRTVEKLAAHHSVTKVAESNSVSRETVRTQLKSIFNKTGCRNQSALVRLITELSTLH
jgi:DNA-binding CsgD family transcriptional regulator